MSKIQSFILFVCVIASTFSAVGQNSESEVQGIIRQLNANAEVEEGCSTTEYSLDGCTMKCTLNCNGSTFVMSFDLGEIGRVYKDKADFEDMHETLFFECKDGKECVTCDSELIPPSPVFPIKLPADDISTIGEDAISVFTKTIAGCK
jgi:hypothetical protein